MTSANLSDALRVVPVVAVLRGLVLEVAVSLGLAAADGGLRAVEVTLDSPGALEAITAIQAAVPDGVAVGAGTVVAVPDVERAVAAGASFLVAPHLDVEVVAAGLAAGVSVIPGVASPTELNAAVRAGAAMVKLFPAVALGPSYVAALRGPYPKVPIMVSGGVTVDSVSSWLEAGASAAGIGLSSLGRSEDEVRQQTTRLVDMLRAVTS